MKDDNFIAMILGIILFVAILAVIVKSVRDNECNPARRGVVQSPGRYGGTLKVCDGHNWVPYRVELPKE